MLLDLQQTQSLDHGHFAVLSGYVQIVGQSLRPRRKDKILSPQWRGLKETQSHSCKWWHVYALGLSLVLKTLDKSSIIWLCDREERLLCRVIDLAGKDFFRFGAERTSKTPPTKGSSSLSSVKDFIVQHNARRSRLSKPVKSWVASISRPCVTLLEIRLYLPAGST